MKRTLRDKISDKLVNAFLKNKIVAPIPKKFTKKLVEADKFRKLCESKVNMPIIGILTLLSQSFLNLSASLSFFVNLFGIGAIILFLRNALTSLSDTLSFKVFVM